MGMDCGRIAIVWVVYGRGLVRIVSWVSRDVWEDSVLGKWLRRMRSRIAIVWVVYGRGLVRIGRTGNDRQRKMETQVRHDCRVEEDQ